MSAYVDDIIDYLEDNSLGTVGTNLFSGYFTDDDNIVGAFDTGGEAPNADVTALHHPTFQIIVVNTDFDTGYTKFSAIRDLLHGIRNTTIGGHYYYYILAISEGGHIGKDEVGRHQFSANFQCKTR